MAYTYTGTPNQRIEQAKRRISTESVDVNSTLSAYQNRVAEIQQQEQAQAQQQEYESNASGIVRFGDTLGEFFKDVATGLEKAFEGIIDFGAGTVGTIAGWAGNNTLKQEMSNFVARDLIGEQWDAARNAGLDVDFDDSYINDLSETGQGIVKGVAEGIGQMLPMVVATVATGGAAGAAATAGKISAGTANAIVKAGQVANIVGLGASAAGRGTEEALNTEIVDEYGNVTKPTLDRAYLYGLATGAVEMATEKLVGGIYSKAVGGGIADNLISKLAKSAKFSKAVKFGLDVMGEGVEEMVSASVEKTLQTIYNSTDGKMHWENPDIQDVFVSGVVGTLTSAVMGGGQVAVRKASSVATTQDAMLDIENTLKKANNLSKKGKLAEQAEALEGEINKSAELIARRYQRASDKGKERLLAIQGVRELLAEDGSVRKTALNEGVAEIAREKAVGAMSGSLALTRRNEVANVVASQNTTIAESLDTEQKSNFAKLEKMLELTGKEAGKQMKVVALEKHEANAFIKDDVMYISKDRLADKNATARDFAHEVFHFAEGTKEYRDVAKMFDRMTIDGKNLFDLATDEVKSLGYEVDAKVFEMLKEGKTAEEITNTGVSEHDVRLALSEIRAKQSEMMFGNAEVITKMAETDQSLAKKILKRIKESIKVIESVFKGDKETLETLKVLRQAEKLWQDALAVSGSKNAVAKQSKRSIAVDSQGRTLSQEQAEFFKDSKIVDKNGNLLVVYHGTPKGTFNEFRTDLGGAYFTTNKEYAQRYAKSHQSNEARLYEAYLNITKPFDTRKAKERKIFENEFYGQWGNGAGLTERGLPDWTDGDDLIDFFAEKGYDYDGLIIDEGGDFDVNGKPVWRGESYVAIYPNQIKSIDNKKPTESNDIRYSLRVGDEDVAVDVEKKKDLVALHNLSADKLMKVLELGGFPMPSIAITKADLPHENYGDITVVFDKTTIDPEEDSRNVVYDRDAWTPTVPIVDVKLNDTKVNNLLDELDDIVDLPIYKNNIRSFLSSNFQDGNGDYVLKEYDFNKKHIGDKADHYEGIIAAYLSDKKGADLTPVYTEKGFHIGWASYTRAEAQEILDAVGITKDTDRDSITEQQEAEMLEKYALLRAKRIFNVIKKRKPDADFETYFERTKKDYIDAGLYPILLMAEDFFNEERPKDVYDHYATLDKLRNQVDDQQKFYDWFWEKISSTLDKKGIDNDSDLFDRYGNRRSFEQRHYTFSLSNLVRAMAKGSQEGNQVFGVSAGSLASKLAKKFDSIESIDEAKQLLQRVSEDEMQEFNDKTYEMYDELVTSIAGEASSFESFTRRDDVGEILGECASVRPLTTENIAKKFKALTRGYDLNYKFNDAIAEKTLSFFEMLANVPTTYFEAKPRRAVTLSEIKSVLLPEDAPEKLVKKLDENGISHETYTSEKSRTDIIKEMDDIRFSKRTDSNGRELTDRQAAYFQDSKVRDKDGNLLVMYHGTDAYKEINVFKKGKSGYLGGGIYLTSDKAYAERYANKNGYKGTIYETYVNAENPLVVTSVDVAREILKAIYGTDTVWKKRTEKQASVTDLITNADINKLRAKGYDGILWDYANSVEISVFESNQIKRVDNENPTYNDDIRYSKRKDSEGHQLTEAQEDFFKDSKVRDENGNLLVVYHGTQTAGFTEFTKSDDIGYFFTNKENNAFTYAGTPTKFEPIIFNNWEEATEYIRKNNLGEVRYDEESSTYLWDDGYDWKPLKYAKDEIRRIADDVQSIIYYGEGDKGIYEVYLNLTNPLVINGKGSAWSAVSDHYEDGKWVDFDELSFDDIVKFEANGYDYYEFAHTFGPIFDVKNYEIAFSQSTREWVKEAKDAGYDGVIFKNIYDNGEFGGAYPIESDVYVALDSNQIKSIDNKTPTNDDDIRYSKRYIYHAGKFNENGHKAETLYTSTPSRHTGFFGTGTYGVDSDHIHELSLGSYKGKPFSVIDISQYNLFDATNDDTAARLHRFLKDITRKAFESKNSEKVNILYNQFKALFPSDKVIAYDEFKSLIDELKQYVKDNEGYTKSKDLDSVSTKFMKHFGYEGVNTIGTYHADTEYGTVIYDLREDSIVVKESTDETQRKAFTDDVRYSKRSFGDTKTKVELLKSLQGMQLDYYGKYYAKIEDPASFFEEGSLGDRLANQILAMADEAEPNKYAFANDLATHIVNNLAVTTVDDYGLAEVIDNANAIREYRHKLNLDGIKGEIQYRYGKKNNIFALWKARKGTTGTYIMDAVDELRYKGVIINAEVDADAFFEMLDMVEYANEQANKVLSGTAKDYLKADEYDALVEGLRDDILSFMENKGTKAEWENYYKTITRQADAYLERAKQKARDIEKLATLEAENALEKAKHAYDKDARKLQNEYETKIKEITNEMQQMALNDIEYNQRYNDLVSKVWSEANSLTMDNIKKYKNASDLLNNEFAGVVKKLSGIKWRGELKKAGTRKIIAEFGKWYNTNNPLLTGGLDQAEIDKMMADDNVVSIGYLDKFALRGIEIMRENQTRESMAGKTKGQQIPNDKQLTYDELMICRAVLSSARHILQSYNTLQIAKQRVKLDETATKTNNLATTMSKITHLKHKTTDKILGLMMQALTPADVIGYQFGYQDNALSDLFQQIQDGETHARSLEIDLNDIIDNFFKEHKHYKKTLSSTIKFGEHEIRRDVALSLYMLTLQEDSREGLLLGGWGYTDDTGYWKEQGKMTEGEIRELSQALSNTDKDFVKTLRRFFNAAGESMAETDMMLKGYSLVDGNANGHYFPIKRYSGDMAKSVADVDAIKNAMSVSVANFSFTHERVKNVRRIDVRPVLSVVKTHAKQVSLYNGLALPIKEFQRLYNFNVADDGSTNSLRNTINEKTWNGFHKYVTKLFEDIQSEKGIKGENGAVSRVLGKVRSNYAKFQLGANMKTWFAQLSGYPAALPYLSPQSMAKAFTKSLYWKSQNAQNLYKYCEWAKVKAHDGGVVLVETLSDKIGVVGEITTKPIQMMDNFLNRILWNAAQFEIERTKGYKFGTKENMEQAGQLHTLLGRKTQGNAATSELSAMQRHTSETVKMLAMFNSDGFKMLSRLFEGITRVRVQNHLAKHNPEMVTAKSQKEAKVFLAKTTTAILTSALIYTLVGELFKFLYDKERKDKEGNEIGFAEDFGMSYLSTVVGMIPIMRDIYSLVVEGYEVDNYALSGITEFITSFEGIAEGVTILASGEPFETKDLARPLKDLVNALGQLTGIPTRNVYNTIYGLTKRFDASAAYKWDSIFYAQGYTTDLKKAIEKDDVDLQKTIIGLMLKDNGLTDTSEKVNNKLRELYAEGYTVLPKTVQDTLHYDGETYNLSNKQVKQFKMVYGKANEEVEDLVNDRHFTSLAAEVQAQAIKWIYDYYYESAVFDTIGEEADSKKQLFGETMDVSKFALTIAACKSIESKLDKKGNVIAGSRKIQIQRLLASLNLSPAEKQLILAYLGYSVADQETLIKAFIRRIGLTKAQQKLLLSYCGIAV